MAKKLSEAKIAARHVIYESILNFLETEEFMYEVESQQVDAVRKEILSLQNRFLDRKGVGSLAYLGEK